MSANWCLTYSLLVIVLHTVSFTGSFLVDEQTKGTTVAVAQSTTEAAETRGYVNKTVCYDGLGCFSNIPPFDNGAALLPASPDLLNTTFFLCTRQEEDCEELDYKSEISTTTTHFNPSKITRIIAHGFTQNSSIYWMQNMKTAFLERADDNVILVDWGNGAKFPNYPQAVANVRLVGAQLYELVQKILHSGSSLKNIHCIGHSLGAHLCGHAGSMLHGQLGRISGMDAAGPEYEGLDPLVRLDPTDALFIDSIHTNKAPIFVGGAGIHQRVGHVDFYLNGGEAQPGCPAITTAIGELIQSGGMEGRKDISCSHGRAHEVFVQSIYTPCPFTAYRCTSAEDFEDLKCTSCEEAGCSQMGLRASKHNTTGMFFLDTLAQEPYCGYHYFARLETNGTDTKGKVMIKLKGTAGDSQWMMATRYENNGLYFKKPVLRAVVSQVDVGQILTITIRYDMTHGFWFFGGQETWEWERVEIISGVNSQRFAVCSNGTALRDGVETEFRSNC